jgi:REP-associated tyrosine transposase
MDILMNQCPQRKSIHLKTFDYKGPDNIYFITICTHDKHAFFSNHGPAGMIINEIKHRRALGEIKVYCYCLMPDHLHLLLSFGMKYDKTLQNWVSAFKRFTSREAKLCFAISPLWQRNFHDHVIRCRDRSPNGPNELIEKAQYILNNPVRKMMVASREEYPYCGMMDELPL